MESATDPKGKVTEFHYDNLDRLDWVLNAAGLLTDYEYDNNGNLKTVVNKDNTTGTVLNTTSSEYNALGLITKVIDPMSRATEYKYTQNGKIAWVKTESGKEANFHYDQLDRLQKISYSDSGNLVEWVFAYDKNNNRTKVDHYVASVLEDTASYTVDEMNRVDSVTVPGGQTIAYKYNPAGQVTRITNSSIGDVVYDYDLSGLNTAITDPQNNRVDYVYDENGRVTSAVTGTGGYRTSITYNAIGQVVEQKVVSSALVVSYSYEYDANGNRNKAVSADGSYVVYRYDDVNQLTDEEYYNAPAVLQKKISYRYDLRGNR